LENFAGFAAEAPSSAGFKIKLSRGETIKEIYNGILPDSLCGRFRRLSFDQAKALVFLMA
jgi:hypothetical protein